MERDETIETQARIALLERALISTLRENAQNWARAESAESRLTEIEQGAGIAERASTLIDIGHEQDNHDHIQPA